jgi:hypothetical protein
MSSSFWGASPFLQAMNAGKPGARIGVFDREASAKLVLENLSTRDAPVTWADISGLASLTQEQTGAVIAYLVDAGMVEQLDDDKVALSSFGRDALGVFAVR